MVDVSELRIPTDELRAWNQGDEARMNGAEYFNPYETRRLRTAWDRGCRGLPMDRGRHDR